MNTMSGCRLTSFSLSRLNASPTFSLSSASSGLLHQLLTPITLSPKPKANKISVCAGERDTIFSGVFSKDIVLPTPSVKVAGLDLQPATSIPMLAISNTNANAGVILFLEIFLLCKSLLFKVHLPPTLFCRYLVLYTKARHLVGEVLLI